MGVKLLQQTSHGTGMICQEPEEREQVKVIGSQLDSSMRSGMPIG